MKIEIEDGDLRAALDRLCDEARAQLHAAMKAEAARMRRVLEHEMSGQSLSYHLSKIADGEHDA